MVGWGSIRFHRESLWPSSESGRGGKEKERRREGGRREGGGAEYNVMNIMTNKRTFQSFVVPFPPTSPNLFNSQIRKRV